MSFDWADYYKIANELITSGHIASSAEARWRTAMSRYYYAFFQLFCEHTATLSQPPPFKRGPGEKGRNHEILKDYLIYHSDREYRGIGEDLKNLHANRILADYEKDIRDCEKKARFSQRVSQNLIKVYSRIISR